MLKAKGKTNLDQRCFLESQISIQSFISYNKLYKNFCVCLSHKQWLLFFLNINKNNIAFFLYTKPGISKFKFQLELVDKVKMSEKSLGLRSQEKAIKV